MNRRDVALAGHMGDAPTARDGLTDSDPGVRATALGALERLDALTNRELAAALADPEPSVRRRAAEVAARHPEVALLDALADADPMVVEMAAWACGERERAEPAVLDRLESLATGHEDALVREAAVAALGAIGADRSLTTILAATQDKATVRRRAVLALAPFEGDAVDAALEQARADRERWQVRQAAEDLLGR